MGFGCVEHGRGRGGRVRSSRGGWVSSVRGVIDACSHGQTFSISPLWTIPADIFVTLSSMTSHKAFMTPSACFLDMPSLSRRTTNAWVSKCQFAVDGVGWKVRRWQGRLERMEEEEDGTRNDAVAGR